MAATGTTSGPGSVAGPGSTAVALTVHGPAGAVDLLVPGAATVADVAHEYAAQAGLAAPPALHTRLGARLDPRATLTGAALGTGAVLVAAGAGEGSDADPSAAQPLVHPTVGGGVGRSRVPGGGAWTWLGVAAGCAALAGGYAATTSGPAHEAAVALLVLAAAVGVLPVGPLASRRAVAAPAFGAAAAFALVWDPVPERLPAAVGVAALVGGVVAAVARALTARAEEALRAWIWTGALVFLVAAGTALLGVGPPVAWSLLLVGALLSTRFVPGSAVDVPDGYLLDLERLAVTAWSARERPRGRRGRTVVSPRLVAEVADRATRVLAAGSVAVLGVCAVAAPLLLRSATLPVDRVGARCLVLLVGGGLLLGARNHRHPVPRVVLRAAGLVCWTSLAVAVLPGLGPDGATGLAAGAVLLAVALLAVAVAAGRGWRSAWWSRRAEVAEALCGAAAIASLVVASGVFRSLWESVHLDV